MPYLPSLPPDADLRDVAATFPEPYGRLRQFGERLMYGPSPFDLGGRELIAAYVSGRNACSFCHGIHAQVAAHHGVDAGLLETLLDDVDAAPVDDRWKALFRYLDKLTATPARIVQADVDALLAAGWSERAVFDACLVGAYFNLLNRVVDGLGIVRDPAYYSEAGARIAAEARSSGGRHEADR